MIETSKALSTAASAHFYQFPVSSMPFQGLAICREVDLSEVGFMAPAPMRLTYEADPHIVEHSRESRIKIHGSSRKLHVPEVIALFCGLLNAERTVYMYPSHMSESQ